MKHCNKCKRDVPNDETTYGINDPERYDLDFCEQCFHEVYEEYRREKEDEGRRMKCPLCPRLVEQRMTDICHHCGKRYCLDCMCQEIIHLPVQSKLVQVCDTCEEKHYG